MIHGTVRITIRGAGARRGTILGTRLIPGMTLGTRLGTTLGTAVPTGDGITAVTMVDGAATTHGILRITDTVTGVDMSTLVAVLLTAIVLQAEVAATMADIIPTIIPVVHRVECVAAGVAAEPHLLQYVETRLTDVLAM